ncbi:MAG: hypothetical protein AB8B99_23055 [Phormidesmis sp.]
MKRFTLSAFSISALSVLMATAIAPTAQARPQADAPFKLQTLRLSEFDARNKSETDAPFKLQTLRLSEFDARNKSEVDAPFKLQTLRLSEFDARNKSEESQQPYYYPQTSTQEAPQTTEPTPAVQSDTVEEADTPAASIAERRQEVLDRS